MDFRGAEIFTAWAFFEILDRPDDATIMSYFHNYILRIKILKINQNIKRKFTMKYYYYFFAP